MSSPNRAAEAPPGAVVSPSARAGLVVLMAGGRCFGLPIETVREVVPAAAYTRLPGSEPFVAGLMNVRGRILTVLDLGARMGLSPSVSRPEHRVVIVDHGRRRIGIAVDELVRLLHVERHELDRSATTLRALGLEPGGVEGVGRVEDRTFVLLDPSELLRPLFT